MSKPMVEKGLRLNGALPALQLPFSTDGLPQDLAEITARWDRIPKAIRDGIVAMVRASDPGDGGSQS
ncbi:MAG: hypothetical protein U0800_08120 [Isosphaeraceae bacterium]